MATNYDSWKQTYSGLNDEQRKKYNDNMQAQGGDVAKMSNEYVQRFNEEQKNQQPLNVESSVSTPENSGKIEGYGTNRDTNGFYTGNSEWEKAQNRELLKKTQGNVNEINQTPEEIQDSINKAQEDMKKGNLDLDTSKYNKDLDLSKFNEAPGEISVKEGTAQETGRPDYQASSQARLNEMKRNLDQYFQDSPRMFQDRETFNKVFEYDSRDSEAQRQLLDSYWKRKQDIDKANGYTTGEAILSGMNNAEITTDQFNLLKEYNPEAYKKWQELQEDEVLKRIINDIVPKTIEEISGKINGMIEALGIQAQEALDIEGVYNDTMERVGAYQTLRDAESTVKKLEDAINKKNSIMNRYANSTGGTVSDALAAARMNKAIAPYNELIQGLQYQYQDYANLYSQKTATALQAANVRVMQANENQRIWNQKCSALGFATSALSYRTPEEQAQLQLQTQQAQNEMQLLQQSKLNDLNLYNQYATAKLENQLQQELTDLSVEDEAQLKANLNNALSTYYQQYGDIIQRSQAQAVEDIIRYAKEKGISVAQAMTENFIKPLQNKPEYKQKIASSYGMLSKQTVATINGKSVILTTNPNGTISYQYIEDPDAKTSTTAKPYDLVDEKVFDITPVSHSYYTLADFINDPDNAKDTWGGQCAKFVNDYLENIGVGRYFGNEDIKTRENRCNSDTAKVGTIAVFDYNNVSSDGINHGHVGIVTKVDDKGFRVLESNFNKDKPEIIGERYVLNGGSSLKGFFDPSKGPSATASGDSEVFEWNGNTYNLGAYSGWDDLTEVEKETVINLLTYQTNPSDLPKSGKDNGASNQKVRAAAAAIGRDNGYSERKFYLVKNAEKEWDDKALKGDVSRNATSVSILKNLAESYKSLNNGDIKKVNQWINGIKTEFGDDVTLSVASNMVVAAEEIAGALKGGASPSDGDTQRILDLFNGNLSNAQADQLFKDFAKNLLDKNMTEADRFAKTTGYKPYSIYTDEVSDRIYNDLGLTDIAKYYNYTPTTPITSGPADMVDEIYSSAKNNNAKRYDYDEDFLNSMIYGRYQR